MQLPSGELVPEGRFLFEHRGRHIDADLIQSVGNSSLGGCRPRGLAVMRDEAERHPRRRSHDDVPEVDVHGGPELFGCTTCGRNGVDVEIDVDPRARWRALDTHVRVAIRWEQRCELFVVAAGSGAS